MPKLVQLDKEQPVSPRHSRKPGRKVGSCGTGTRTLTQLCNRDHNGEEHVRQASLILGPRHGLGTRPGSDRLGMRLEQLAWQCYTDQHSQASVLQRGWAPQQRFPQIMLGQHNQWAQELVRYSLKSPGESFLLRSMQTNLQINTFQLGRGRLRTCDDTRLVRVVRVCRVHISSSYKGKISRHSPLPAGGRGRTTPCPAVRDPQPLTPCPWLSHVSLYLMRDKFSHAPLLYVHSDSQICLQWGGAKRCIINSS